MALQLTLPAVTIGNLQIPERTFTEGIDFEIGSILQEGETTYREEMVAIVPTGNNSQVFRDYAQHIGSQRAVLTIDLPEVPTARPVVPPGEELPDIPGDFTRTALTHNSVTLTWTAAAHAAGYDLFFSTSSSRPTRRTTPTLSIGNVQTYTRTGLTPETTYYAYVRARNSNGTSDWTSGEVFTTAAPPVVIPAAVTGFGSTASTYDTITYGWTAVSGATGYDLYFSESSTAPAADASPTASVGAVTAYTRTGLTGNTGYYGYIRATNSAGASAWSAAVMVTTPAPPLRAPGVPTGFRSTAQTFDSITYGWTATSGATGYDIWVTAGTGAPSSSTTPTATVGAVTTYTATNLLGQTTYRAYLRAKNAAGDSAWSGAVVIATRQQVPGAVADFESTANTHDSITYGWTATAGATGYDLYLTPSMTPPVSATVPTASVGAVTTYTRTGLEGSTAYNAYLRATNAAGAGAWSSGISVTTSAPPPPAVPANVRTTSVLATSIAIAWDASAGANSYEVYITRGDAPAVDTVPTATVRSEAYTATGLSSVTTYRIFVRAVGDTGTSDWSAALSAQTPALPPAPVPDTPTGFGSTASTSDSITYAWAASAGAIFYGLYLTTDSTDIPDETTQATAFLHVTNHTAMNLSPSTTYYAYLAAGNMSGVSDWTSAVTVTTPAAPVQAPTVPPGFSSTAQTHASITYEWTAVASAVSYDLYISTSSTAPTAETVAVAQVGGVTTYTRTGLSATTQYYAFIRARNSAGASAWSPAVSATTSAAPLPPAVPTGFARTASTHNSITYGWTAVTGATGYDLFVSVSTTPPSASTVPTASVGAVTTYSATSLLDNTEYRAYIRATNADGDSAWSAAVVAQTDRRIVIPAVPTGFFQIGATHDTLTYEWLPTPGATGYDFYISTSSTAPAADTELTAELGAVTTYTATGLMSDTRYYVFLRAKNSAGNSAWTSGHWSTTALAVPDVPTGITFNFLPARNFVPYSWNAVPTATSYEIYWRTTPDAPTASSLPTVTVTSPRWALTGWFRNQFYYFYVRARNAAGVSAWSPVIVLSTRIGVSTPIPQPPTGLSRGAISYDRAIVRWNMSQYATRYDVYIKARRPAVGGGWQPRRQFDVPGRSTVPTGTARALFFEFRGLRAEQLYDVYVRAKDDVRSRSNSRWARIDILTTARPPTLRTPDTPTSFVSTRVSASTITYRWSKPRQAAGYDLYVTTSELAPAADTDPTVSISSGDATETTVPGLQSDTRYYAYLRAKNAAGISAWTNALAVSTPRIIPAGPAGFHIAGFGGTNILLRWNPVAGVSRYELYVTPARSGTPFRGGMPPENTRPTHTTRGTVYDVTGLRPETRYACYVRFVNARGPSLWSGPLFNTTPVGLPSVPSMFDYSSVTNSSITYEWEYQIPSRRAQRAGAGIPREYDLYVNTLGLAPTQNTVPTVSSIPAGDTYIYTGASGLTAATTYYAWLRATNEGGRSDWTEYPVVVATSAAPTAVPVAPTGLQITDMSNTAATVVWNPTPGATHYRVRLSDFTGQVSQASVQGQPIRRLENLLDYPRLTDTTPPIPVSFRTGRRYTITINGVNSHGNGPSTSLRFTTPGYQVATVKPRDPEIIVGARTQTSIAFSTEDAPDGRGQPLFYDYLISPYDAPTRDSVPTGSVYTPDGMLDFVLTGLEPGRSYTTYFRTRNQATSFTVSHGRRVFRTANGESAWVEVEDEDGLNPRTLRATGPPGTPTLISSTHTETTITLNWERVRYANGYVVFLRGPAGTVPERYQSRFGLGRSGHTNTRLVLTGLTPNTTYRVRIYAYSGWNNGASSREVVVTTTLPAPEVPTNLRVTGSTYNSMSLSWNATARAIFYDVYARRTGEGSAPTARTSPTQSFEATATRTGSLTGIGTVTGLGYGVSYQMYIRARNNTGSSAWSAAVTGTTPARPATPPVPTNFETDVVGWDSITYQWSAAERAEGYDLYYIRGRIGEPVAVLRDDNSISVDDGAVTTGTITGLLPGFEYRAFLRAKNVSGMSAWTEVVTATTTVQPPPLPGGFVLDTRTSAGTTFRWTTPARATDYDLYVTAATDLVPPTATTTPTFSFSRSAATETTRHTFSEAVLSSNVEYRVYLRAKNAGGVSAWTGGLYVGTVVHIPPVPTGFAVSQYSATTISYTWNHSVRADGYDLYISFQSDVPTAQTVPTVRLGRVTEYVARTLRSNEEYYAYIRSRNQGGQSAWSAVVTQRTREQLPDRPENVRTFVTESSVGVRWNAAARATGGYDIIVRKAGIGDTFPTAGTPPTASVAAGVTQYIRTGLESRTLYLIYVRAKNSAGASAWRGPRGIHPVTSSPVPAALMGMEVVQSTYNSITYRWPLDPGVPGRRFFDLYFSTSATPPVNRGAATVSLTALYPGFNRQTQSYTRTGLSGNTQYYAYIRSRTGDNIPGPWSAATTFTTPVQPSPVPADFASSASTHNSITYTWTAAARAAGYDLYVTQGVTAPTVNTLPTAQVGAVTTYTAAGLQDLTTYRAYIRATNSGGRSEWSAVVATATPAEPLPGPSAPTNFVSSAQTQNSITYTWTASTGATGYDIFMATGQETARPNSRTVPTHSVGTVTTFTRSGLAANTRYRAYIRAKNAMGVGAWTAVLSTVTAVDTTVTAPATPTGFQGDGSPLHNRLGFFWSRGVDYDFYISVSSTAPTAQTVPTDFGRGSSYIARGLTPNTQYWGFVRAKNAGGNSAWTAGVSQTTMALPAAPAAPAGPNLTATALDHSRVFLRFYSNFTTGYDIYYSTSATAPTAQTVPTVSVTNGPYTARGLMAATQYYFFVRAKNDGGTSAWSAAVTATTSALPAVPPVPTNFLRARTSDNYITYEWDATDHSQANRPVWYDLLITTEDTAPAVDATPTGTVPSNLNAYTAPGLSAATDYNAYIRGRNDGGTSAWSSPAIATTTSTARAIPPSPAQFVSSAKTQNSITYTWQASARAGGYDIYLSTTNTAPEADTTPTASVGTVTTYTATGLSASTRYYAFARARNRTGNSAWTSGLAIDTLGAATAVPAVPTGLTATDATRTSGTFVWDAAAGATGYDLYFTLLDGTAPTAQTAATDTVGNVTTFRKTLLLRGGSGFDVYIRARNSVGTSAWSSAFRFHTEPSVFTLPPDTPTNIQATGGYRYIDFFAPSNVRNTFIEIYLTTDSTLPTRDTAPTYIWPYFTGSGISPFRANNLETNKAYHCYIRERNSAGTSDWSEPITVQTTAAPLPTGFAFSSSTDTTATFTWTAATGATGYDLYVIPSDTFTTRPTALTVPTASFGAATTTGGVTGLTPSTNYFAFLRATTSEGSSNWTEDVGALTQIARPSTPVQFGHSAFTHNSLTYTWTASARAAGYDIYISESATPPTAQTTPTAQVGSVTTYTATGLSADTPHYSFIRARNAGGVSDWSGAAQQRTLPLPAIPPVPTGFASTRTLSTQITFGWTAAARATGYDLYVTTSATAPTSSTSPTLSVGAVTAGTVTGLTGGTAYRAYIRAENDGGTSDWSSAVMVTTAAAQTYDATIAVPGMLRVRVTGYQSGVGITIRITWNAVAGATGYDLYNINEGEPSFIRPTQTTVPGWSVGAVTELADISGFPEGLGNNMFIRARIGNRFGPWGPTPNGWYFDG